ncbi:hypothetical protein D3C73_1105460 [compost metagenome]
MVKGLAGVRLEQPLQMTFAPVKGPGKMGQGDIPGILLLDIAENMQESRVLVHRKLKLIMLEAVEGNHQLNEQGQ